MVLVGAIPPLSSSRLHHGLQQRLLGEATELLLHEITDNPAARSTSIPSAPGSVHLTLHRHNTDTCDSTLDRLLWWRRLPLPFAPARPRAWYARYPRSDGEVGSHPTTPSDCGAIHRLLGSGCNFWCTRPGNPDCRPFLRPAVVAAPPTTTAVCRRRARSTRASLAFLSWCHHGGLRCRGASLTAASVLRRRLCVPSPCSLDVGIAGFSKLVPSLPCAVQGCRCDCTTSVLSTSAVCAVAVLPRRERRWLL